MRSLGLTAAAYKEPWEAPYEEPWAGDSILEVKRDRE